MLRLHKEKGIYHAIAHQQFKDDGLFHKVRSDVETYIKNLKPTTETNKLIIKLLLEKNTPVVILIICSEIYQRPLKVVMKGDTFEPDVQYMPQTVYQHGAFYIKMERSEKMYTISSILPDKMFRAG